MTIARDLGFEVRVDNLARSDLYIAEEIFVCGTAAEVSSVNSVDDRAIPCPGPKTKAIAEVYARAVRGEEDRSTRTGASSPSELATPAQLTASRSMARNRSRSAAITTRAFGSRP